MFVPIHRATMLGTEPVSRDSVRRWGFGDIRIGGFGVLRGISSLCVTLSATLMIMNVPPLHGLGARSLANKFMF